MSRGPSFLALTAREAGLVACRRCTRVWPMGETTCRRCGGRLASRDVRSLSRVWAWWAAGLMAYVPANLYPMLETRTLFTVRSDTVVMGALDLLRDGNAGIAIVILAIVLDRLSEQFSARLDPHKRALAAATAPSRRLVRGAGALTVAAILIGLVAPIAQEFPEAIAISFADPVNAVVDWLRSDVAWLTGWIKDAVTYTFINPVETIFTTTPVWLAIFLASGIALLVRGLRQAVVAGACLALIYLIGLWEDSMVTLVQVLAATIITFSLGLLLGIASARSDRFSSFIRPGLDVAQTMPSFVYLLPAFVLFDASRFTAIFAAVIFALPPVIRLVDVGIRAVPGTIVEAATSSGSTSRQLLFKVQLPVARGALQLAANQAVIIVLSMVVVGGFVGGGGLGYDVVAGFSQPRLFGMGVAAGIALGLLGLMLDRMTQGPTRAGGARHS